MTTVSTCIRLIGSFSLHVSIPKNYKMDLRDILKHEGHIRYL